MADYLSDFGVDIRYVNDENPRQPHDVNLLQLKEALEAFRSFAKGKLGELWGKDM